MKLFRTLSLFTVAILLLLVMGCAKKYVITTELSESINTENSCLIGEIGDKLPLDFDPEKKPTIEHIDKLKNYLVKELEKKDIFSAVGLSDPSPNYVVEGNILDFKEGSGALRFFIGFGAGNAKLTVELSLINKKTNEIIFGGNFKQTVSSGGESGDAAFKRVAQDFAKALEKQFKNMTGK